MSDAPDGNAFLETILLCYFLQPPSQTLISDASGDNMGGYYLESGLRWRIDFTYDMRLRLRTRVHRRDDLSMNMFVCVIGLDRQRLGFHCPCQPTI